MVECKGGAALFCIQCGTPLPGGDEERWEARTCPSCGRIHYRQRKVGAGVLVQEAGGLLLAQRGPVATAFPGAWNLPAGYCGYGESPREAAAREAAEETGLSVRPGRLVDAYPFDDDPRGNGVLLVYEAQITGGALRADGRETAALGFFPADRLPHPLCGGGHDQAIRAWQARAQDRWQPGLPFRHCPHCTHVLEERLAFGRQRLACPACGYVHFRDPKVGVSALIERQGRLLLVRRAIEPGLGLWSLPSGFVEWDEGPETAVARECREETGLAVAGLRLLDASHYTADFRGPGINLTYSVQVAGEEPQPGDDAAEVRFFAPGDLPATAEIAFPGHALAVERWRREQRPEA